MSKLTIFQKHLLNLTVQSSNIITPYESLRGFLSLGFDFPVAFVSSIALPFVYGNTGFLSHKIDVAKIPSDKQPTQLESVVLSEQKGVFTRKELIRLVNKEHRRNKEKMGTRARLFDEFHLLGVWVIGAQTHGAGEGLVDRETVEAFQAGDFFEFVRERRKDRGDILPLWRGGPIS